MPETLAQRPEGFKDQLHQRLLPGLLRETLKIRIEEYESLAYHATRNAMHFALHYGQIDYVKDVVG